MFDTMLGSSFSGVAHRCAIRYERQMLHALIIFLGGGLGATGRHFVGQGALRLLGPGFPYGTLLVNVAGSLLMGLFIGWLVRKGADGGEMGSQELRLFFATGLLGGFTTFSAYSLDIANLWERGAAGLALIYALGTVVACVVAIFAGLYLARAVNL